MNIGVYTGKHEADGLWLPLADFNALFFVDQQNNIKYIGKFPMCGTSDKWKIVKIIPCRDYILFFLRNNFSVWKMDRKNNNMQYIEIAPYKVGLIYGVECIGNYAWVFPDSFNLPIIQFDIYTLEGKEISWQSDELGNDSIVKPVLGEKEIYFANRSMSAIMLGKLTADGYITYKKISDARYINCICYMNQKIFVLYRNAYGRTIVGEYDSSLNEINKNDYTAIIPTRDSQFIDYWIMASDGKQLYIVQGSTDKVFSIDVESGKCSELEAQYERKADRGFIAANDVELYNGKMFLYSKDVGSVRCIDYLQNKVFAENIEIDKELYFSLWHNSVLESKIIDENQRGGINELIQLVQDISFDR